jgi:hypothetical protein
MKILILFKIASKSACSSRLKVQAILALVYLTSSVMMASGE